MKKSEMVRRRNIGIRRKTAHGQTREADRGMRGHIRKRGSSWSVVIYLGRDPQTLRKRWGWYTHPTRRDAERHLAQLLAQAHGGVPVPAHRLRLGEYLQQWLDDAVRHSVSPATAVRYRHIVQRRLIPALGYIPLLRLSPQSIQRYLADVMSSGLSPSTALYDYRVLHAALARAERWGYIGRNPARHVDPPSPAPREATIWDEEQVRLFLADAKRHSPYYALYLTAVLTGLRQGELLGLRWRDVDLAIGTVQVRQTIYRLYGAGRQDPIVAKAPKSRKSRRVVPIPRVVRAVLMELRDATAYGSRPDWTRLVFCQPNGKPLHAANIVRRDFHARIARLGLPRIRFHDLRHTYASHLYRLCRDASVVRDALGHASSAFTLDTYDHPISSLMLQASEELAGRLQHSAYEQEIERTC